MTTEPMTTERNDGESISRRARRIACLVALGLAGAALLSHQTAEAQWGRGYGYGYRSSGYAPYDPYRDGGYYYPGSRTYFGTTTPLMFPGGLGYEYNYPGGYHEIYPHGPYDRFRPHPHSATQIGPYRYEHWR